MIVAMIALAMLVMRLFPDTPTGRFLHRWLAEKPVAWIAGVKRKQIIFVLLTVAVVLTLREAAPMLAGTSELALFGIWDASVYLDVVMAVWTLAALSRGRAGWAVLQERVAQRFSGRRSRVARPRARRTRPVRPRVSNDDDGLVLALAA